MSDPFRPRAEDDDNRDQANASLAQGQQQVAQQAQDAEPAMPSAMARQQADINNAKRLDYESKVRAANERRAKQPGSEAWGMVKGNHARQQEQQAKYDERLAADSGLRIQENELAAQKDALRIQQAEQGEATRRHAAQGGETVTDPATGRSTIAKNPDGTDKFKVGEVGDPKLAVIEQPGPSRDGGPLVSAALQQSVRNAHGQTGYSMIEQKTDKDTGEIYSEAKDQFGQVQRVPLGQDPKIPRLNQLQQEIDTRAMQLQALDVQRLQIEPRHQPAEAELRKAKNALEAPPKYIQVDGRWVPNKYPDITDPAGRSKWAKYESVTDEMDRENWMRKRAAEQHAYDLAKKNHDATAPAWENLQKQQAEVKLRHEQAQLQKKRVELSLPDEDGGVAEILTAAETGQPPADQAAVIDALNLHGLNVSNAQAPKPGEGAPAEDDILSTVQNSHDAGDAPDAPLIPPTDDASIVSTFTKALRGIKNPQEFTVGAKGKTFRELKRNGNTVGTLYNDRIAINEYGGADLQSLIDTQASGGFPVYIRDNFQTPPNPAAEAAWIAEIHGASSLPEMQDPATFGAFLEEKQASPPALMKRIKSGEISVTMGGKLLKELYGMDLQTGDYNDPSNFQKWLQQTSERELKTGTALIPQNTTAAKWAAASKDRLSLSQQENIKNDYAADYVLGNQLLTRAQQKALYAHNAQHDVSTWDRIRSMGNATIDLGKDVAGSSLGMPIGLAEDALYGAAAIGSGNAREHLSAKMKLRNMSTEAWRQGVVRFTKALATEEGRAAASERTLAMREWQQVVDNNHDLSTPDQAAEDSAAQKAIAATLRLHNLALNPDDPIESRHLDPAQDKALRLAMMSYKTTADPRAWALLDERILMSNARRRVSSEMEELAGPKGGLWGAVNRGSNAGWEEILSEAASWATLGAFGAAAKGGMALNAATKGNKAWQATRLGKLGGSIYHGVQKAAVQFDELGKVAATLENPLTTGQRAGNAMLRGGKVATIGGVTEGYEELVPEIGSDNPEFLKAFGTGLLGGVMLLPVGAVQAKLGETVATHQQQAKLQDGYHRYAREYNKLNSDLPGFQPIDAKTAEFASLFVSPQQRVTDMEHLGGQINALQDFVALQQSATAAGQPLSPELGNAEAHLASLETVSTALAEQDIAAIDSVGEFASLKPDQKTNLVAYAKAAAGRADLLTPQERRTIQGKNAELRANIFQGDTVTPEGMAYLTTEYPVLQKLPQFQQAAPVAGASGSGSPGVAAINPDIASQSGTSTPIPRPLIDSATATRAHAVTQNFMQAVAAKSPALAQRMALSPINPSFVTGGLELDIESDTIRVIEEDIARHIALHPEVADSQLIDFFTEMAYTHETVHAAQAAHVDGEAASRGLAGTRSQNFIAIYTGLAERYRTESPQAWSMAAELYARNSADPQAAMAAWTNMQPFQQAAEMERMFIEGILKGEATDPQRIMDAAMGKLKERLLMLAKQIGEWIKTGKITTADGTVLELPETIKARATEIAKIVENLREGKSPHATPSPTNPSSQNPGNHPSQPAPGQTGAGTGPAAKADGHRPTHSDGRTQPPPSDDAGASAAPTAEQVAAEEIAIKIVRTEFDKALEARPLLEKDADLMSGLRVAAMDIAEAHTGRPDAEIKDAAARAIGAYLQSPEVTERLAALRAEQSAKARLRRENAQRLVNTEADRIIARDMGIVSDLGSIGRISRPTNALELYRAGKTLPPEWNGMLRFMDYDGGGKNAVARAIIAKIYAPDANSGISPDEAANGLQHEFPQKYAGMTPDMLWQELQTRIRTYVNGADTSTLDDPDADLTDAQIDAALAKNEQETLREKWNNLPGFKFGTAPATYEAEFLNLSDKFSRGFIERASKIGYYPDDDGMLRDDIESEIDYETRRGIEIEVAESLFPDLIESNPKDTNGKISSADSGRNGGLLGEGSENTRRGHNQLSRRILPRGLSDTGEENLSDVSPNEKEGPQNSSARWQGMPSSVLSLRRDNGGNLSPDGAGIRQSTEQKPGGSASPQDGEEAQRVLVSRDVVAALEAEAIATVNERIEAEAEAKRPKPQERPPTIEDDGSIFSSIENGSHLQTDPAPSIKDRIKRWVSAMPGFQGGKAEMAGPVTQAVEESMTPAQRGHFTTAIDYFGGGGSWAIFNALTSFKNIRNLIVYERNTDRVEKIRLFHEKGHMVGEMLKNPTIVEALKNAAAKAKAAGVPSGSAIARRINIKGISDPLIIGLKQAITDYLENSFGTKADDTGNITPEAKVAMAIRIVSQEAAAVYQAVTEFKKRGGTIEYRNANSYEAMPEADSRTLAFVDPPYFLTKGYSYDEVADDLHEGQYKESITETTVGTDTYGDTAALLKRLADAGNGIIYTDSAWWKTIPKETDSQAAAAKKIKKKVGDVSGIPMMAMEIEQAEANKTAASYFGLTPDQRRLFHPEGRRILSDIASTLDRFDVVSGEIGAKRKEVLGIHYGNQPTTNTGRGARPQRLLDRPQGQRTADGRVPAGERGGDPAQQAVPGMAGPIAAEDGTPRSGTSDPLDSATLGSAPTTPLDPQNPFGEWGASLREDDVLIGYRGENGNGQADNNFGSSEGVGLYLAKTEDDTAFFGKARMVNFPKPKRPLIVDEDGGLDIIPLLNEENDVIWNRIFSHQPRENDSDWMKAHTLAAKQIGLTEDTWAEKHEQLPRALTDKLLAMGYDAVYVRSGGMEWINLLAKEGQRFSRSARSPGGASLYSAPSSNFREVASVAQTLSQPPNQYQYEPDANENRQEVRAFLAATGYSAHQPPAQHAQQADRIGKATGASIVFVKGPHKLNLGGNRTDHPSVIYINTEYPHASIGYGIVHELVHVAQKDSRTAVVSVMARINDMLSDSEKLFIFDLLQNKYGYDGQGAILVSELQAFLVADAVMSTNYIGLENIARKAELRPLLIDFFHGLPKLKPDNGINELFSTGTQRATLGSAPAANPAAQYRYLKAKQEKAGLTPAENEALLRAEKAMGQEMAFDMDSPDLRARKGSISPAFQPSLNLETQHPITGRQLALFSPASQPTTGWRQVFHSGTMQEAYDPTKADMDAQYGPGFYTAESANRAKSYGKAEPRKLWVKTSKTFDHDARITRPEANRIVSAMDEDPAILDSLYADEKKSGTSVIGEDVWTALKDTFSPLIANEALQMAGYDSATYTGNRGKDRDWIVFSPEQIRTEQLATLQSAPSQPDDQAALEAALRGLDPIYTDVLKASIETPTPSPAALAARFNLPERAIHNIIGTVRTRIQAQGRSIRPGGLQPARAADGRIKGDDKNRTGSDVPVLAAFDQIQQQEKFSLSRADSDINRDGQRIAQRPDALDFLLSTFQSGNRNDAVINATNRYLREASIRGDSSPKLTALAIQFREEGARQSDEFRARKDAHHTPAERNAMLFQELFTAPNKQVRKAYESAKTPEAKFAVLEAFNAKVKGLKDALKAREGIDLDAALARLAEQRANVQAGESYASEAHQKLVDALNAEVASLRQQLDATTGDAAKATAQTKLDEAEQNAARAADLDPRNTIRLELEKLRPDERTAVETIRDGGTWEQAASRTFMSIREVRQVFRRFTDALDEAAIDAILLAEDLMLGKQATLQSPASKALSRRDKARAGAVAMRKAMGYDENAVDRRSTGKPAKGTRKKKETGQEPAMMSDAEFKARQANPDTHKILARPTPWTSPEMMRDLWQAEAALTGQRISFEEWQAKPETQAIKARQERLFREPINETKGNLDMHDDTSVKHAYDALNSLNSTLFDKAMYFWKASILSGIQTGMVNFGGNLAHDLYTLGPKRILEAGVNDALGIIGMGSKDAATLGELRYAIQRTHTALKKAASTAVRSWSEDSRVTEAEYLNLARQFGLDGRASDLFPKLLGGKLGAIMHGISFRHMTAADEMIKAFHVEMSVMSHAYRIARKEGLKGDAIRPRMDELINEKGSAAWRKAYAEAEWVTFQRHIDKDSKRSMDKAFDPIARGLRRFSQTGTGVFKDIPNHEGKMVKTEVMKPNAFAFFFPFVMTPLNIFKIGMEMSPIGVFFSALDAARSLKARMSSGHLSKEAAEAEAQAIYNKLEFVKDLTNQIIGITLFWALGSLVKPGEDDEDARPWITGSTDWKKTSKGDRDVRDRVLPAYSIRIGDTSFSYQRLEPFGTALGLLVDLRLAVEKRGWNDAALGEFMATAISQFNNKTYMKGISDLSNAAHDPHRFLSKLTSNIATGFIPNLIRQPIREADPYIRDTSFNNDEGLVEGTIKRLGYSLAPAYAPIEMTVWGDPKRRSYGQQVGGPIVDAMRQAVDPLNTTIGNQPDPLDLYLFNWNNSTADMRDRFNVEEIKRDLTIQRNGKTHHLTITTEDHQEANRNAGQTAKELLKARMQSEGWNPAKPEKQNVEHIKETLRRFQYRERDRLRAKYESTLPVE